MVSVWNYEQLLSIKRDAKKRAETPRPFVRVTLFETLLFVNNRLQKMVLTFKCVDETLVCDHSNESYWAVLSCGTVYYAVQGGSNFLSLWMKP